MEVSERLSGCIDREPQRNGFMMSSIRRPTVVPSSSSGIPGVGVALEALDGHLAYVLYPHYSNEVTNRNTRARER